MRTVIRDNNYAALKVLESTMTPLAALPLKTAAFRYLTQFFVSNQAERGQADTSTRQVPMKSGSGSPGEAVLRYVDMASRIFDSRDGKSGAWV